MKQKTKENTMNTQKIIILIAGCFFSVGPLIAGDHKKCIDGCKEIKGDMKNCILACTEKYLSKE